MPVTKKRERAKRRNGAIALLMALMLALNLFPVVLMGYAADYATIAVGAPIGEVPEDGYAPGETFRVPVTITDNPGFSGATFAVKYDTTVFELTDIDDMSGMFGAGRIFGLGPNIADGILAYLHFGSDETRDGLLFYVDFRVKVDAPAGSYGFYISPENLDRVPNPGNFTNWEMQPVSAAYPTSYITVQNDEPPAPADPATISLGSVAETQAGETFTVPVSIADNPGFSGALFTLNYDTAALEITSVSATGALFEDGLVWDAAAPARVGYVKMGSDPLPLPADVTGDGKLFDVTFKVKDGTAPGSYQIGLALADGNSSNFANANAEVLGVDFVVTSVTVPAPVPPTPTISLGSIADAQAGETFTVPVNIANNPGFSGALFTIGYNVAALEITSVSAAGALFADGLVWDAAAPARVGYVKMGSDPLPLPADVTGDGKLFDVTFKVKDGTALGSYQIGLALADGNSSNFANANAEVIGVDFSGTSVKVAAEGTSIWIASDAISGYPGGQIIVPVTITGNPGFSAAIFQISFDEDLEWNGFDFTDTIVTEGQMPILLDPEYPSGVNPNNTIAPFASLTDPTILFEGDGVLFNLLFNIKAGAAVGSHGIGLELYEDEYGKSELSFLAFDNDLKPVSLPVTCVPGSVEALDQILPTAADLDYDLPQTVTYDGESHAVAVTAKDGIGLGAITIYYTGTGTTDYAKTTAAPTNAGTYSVTVDIAPNVTYAQVLGLELGTLTIEKAAAPTIDWPTASDITYGAALSTSTLGFVSNSYGTFAWDSSVNLDAIPNAGTPAYPVIFTPSDATLNNYEAISPLTKDVTVTVHKAAAPTFDWPTASDITYGAPLSISTLSFTINSYGAFAWDSSVNLGAVPAAGTSAYPVIFTPSDATLNNYEAISPLTKDVTVTVHKALAPTIDWPTAGAVKEGSTLSASAFEGGSTEYGEFAWAEPSTVLSFPGGLNSATFTPSADTLNNYEDITDLAKSLNVAVRLAGDVDNDGYRTAADVLYHVLILSGNRPLPQTGSLEFQLADMDDDEAITITDTMLLLKRAMGLS